MLWIPVVRVGTLTISQDKAGTLMISQDSGNVNDLPGQSGNVNDLPGQSGNVNDLPGQSGNVNDLPGQSGNVNDLPGQSGNVNDLPGQSGNINDLPGQSGNVDDLPNQSPQAGGNAAPADVSDNQKSGTDKQDQQASGTDKQDQQASGTDKQGQQTSGTGATRRRRRNLDTSHYRDSDKTSVHTQPSKDKNYKFYTNQIPFEPNGDYIDNIHATWRGDYDLLDRQTRLIQWLFPTQEMGMNEKAQVLQSDEIEQMKTDDAVKTRLQSSYAMMLDFYGMQVKDAETGEIERGNDWRDRFMALNRSPNNYLRITRIVKSLGLLGFEHYQFPFVKFCLQEVFIDKTLRNAAEGCLELWINAVKDDEKRKTLFEMAYRLK